VLLPDGMNLNQ